MSTMLFVASLPFYFYICWRLTVASQIILPDRVTSLRVLLILVGLWYAAFPLICVLAYRIRFVPKLMNGNAVTDFTLAYPFWIVAVDVGQTIPHLLVVDLASLVARHSGYFNLGVFRSAGIRGKGEWGESGRCDVCRDLFTRGTDHIDEGVACLASIRAKYGPFECLGNHDIWLAPRMITTGVQSAGIKLVEDSQETIHVGGATIGLSVVTNAYSSRPVVGAEELSLVGDISILLTHQPSAEFVRQASEMVRFLCFRPYPRRPGRSQLVQLSLECILL
jgi:hypothetical protein